MRADRFTILLLTAASLSACAGAPSPDYRGSYAPAAPAAGAPLASLPASAGRVVAVRRRAFDNGLSERVVLDGPRGMAGENAITVEVVTGTGSSWRAARRGALAPAPPSSAAIAAEMEGLFPDLRMRVSEVVDHNPQGPFGYATGTAGPLACVYGWQYLAPSHALTLLEGASDTGSHPVSIRVRLCRDAPVAALVEDLRRLTVTGPDDAPAATGPRQASLPGDALDAAVGGTLPRDAASPNEGADAPGLDAPKPGRRARPGALPHPRHARRIAAPRHPRPAVLRAVERAEGPRVPMPSEVVAPTRAPEPAPAGVVALKPRPATADPDALPLPR